MYVVPAHRDPTYNSPQEDERKFGLGDIRALVAEAGEVLCWNQALLHWGSRSSDLAPAPRISLSMEFQRGDLPPFNNPLLDPGLFPDLRGRLVLIAKQLVQYSHMYVATPPVEAFLRTMLGQAGAGSERR